MTQVLPTNHGGADGVFRRILNSAIEKTSAEPVYPVKVSANGRYFVDQKGTPVFWLGTTQWQLFREYSLDDARTIIEKSKEKGFAFAQVMLMGVGDGTKPNIHGEKPWHRQQSPHAQRGLFQECRRRACRLPAKTI